MVPKCKATGLKINLMAAWVWGKRIVCRKCTEGGMTTHAQRRHVTSVSGVQHGFVFEKCLDSFENGVEQRWTMNLSLQQGAYFYWFVSFLIRSLCQKTNTLRWFENWKILRVFFEKNISFPFISFHFLSEGLDTYLQFFFK